MKITMNILQSFPKYQIFHHLKCHNRFIQCSTFCTTSNTNVLLSSRNHIQQQRSINSLTVNKFEAKPSIFKKILKTLGITSVYEAKLNVNGSHLYESVVDKLDYEYWMTENKLPDNFMSWFLITELHIWMLLVRSMREGEEGRIVRNATIEAMWVDVGIRSVKYHPGSRSLVRKQVQLLSQEFQAALVGYDEGFVANDRVLACAVWRRFFMMNNDDPILIENIVRYIRRQLHELDKVPKEEFFNYYKIKWIPLNEKKSK